MNFFDAPWLSALWSHIAPAADLVAMPTQSLIFVLAISAAAIIVPMLWVRVRLLITLVHELGHAVVGVLAGRKFTGFILRGDMSGAAVTAGPVRGFGRVITTWAGYPAPAVIGATFAWFGSAGWGAPVISAVLLILLLALIRVRSWLTALVMVIAIAGFAALWWWRDDTTQTTVLLGLAVVLVVGAWRHLGAVLFGGGPTSDPAVLAKLTGVPRFVWNFSFVIVCAFATSVVGVQFATLVP